MSDYPHDVLARDPIRVSDETKVEDLVPEMRERIEALLDLYGCDASLEGWRKLALSLALEHVPTFKLETPADRTGSRSGIGGRPVTMETFRLRGEWLKEMDGGGSERAIAARLEKRLGIPAETIRGRVRRKQPMPDSMHRATYTVIAEHALADAAKTLVEE